MTPSAADHAGQWATSASALAPPGVLGAAAPQAPRDSLPRERLCQSPEPPPPLTLRNVPPPPELRPALLREVPAQTGTRELQHPLRCHSLHGHRRARTDRAADGAAATIRRSSCGRRCHVETARQRLPALTFAEPQPIRAIAPPRHALHPIRIPFSPGPAHPARLQPISAATPHGPGGKHRAPFFIRECHWVSGSENLRGFCFVWSGGSEGCCVLRFLGERERGGCGRKGGREEIPEPGKTEKWELRLGNEAQDGM